MSTSWDVVKFVFIGLATVAVLYYFVLRRLCIDTTPRNLQVYMALRSPTVREARSALDRRLALAVREASQPRRTCTVCGFANAARAAVVSCSLCGTSLPPFKKSWRTRCCVRNELERSSVSDASGCECSRMRRASLRREWVRTSDRSNGVVWRRDDRLARQEFTSYVLQTTVEQPQRSPPESLPEQEASQRDLALVTQPDYMTGEEDIEANIEISIDRDASPTAVATVARRLDDMRRHQMIRVVDVTKADPVHVAFSTIPIGAIGTHLDFPAKLVQFMTSAASLLSETKDSQLPSVARFFITRSGVWNDSVAAIATMAPEQARFPIRVAFIGEPGIDAGALYREWFGLLTKAMTNPKAGIFTCVDPHEQTFYLNSQSQDVLGDAHLAHFLVAGRLIGRALLDGNVTGFQLAPPLLKIMLGLPVSFPDLEYYDAEAYKSLQWLITNEGVDMLGLDFTVVEKLPDGKTRIIELVPGGSEIDVTDANKMEYIDRKLQYLLFESVQSQLFAFLTGLYEVVPPELLIMFDAEELGLLLSGSDEIDVDDWEANTLAYLDIGAGDSSKRLNTLPCYDNFWKVVREMSNEERRRLLHFATGSTRPPPGGFSSLTSYDGRLALFTLRGVDENATHGNLQSHACFNRVDLPTFWRLKSMRRAVHAAISIHEDGFTIA